MSLLSIMAAGRTFEGPAVTTASRIASLVVRILLRKEHLMNVCPPSARHHRLRLQQSDKPTNSDNSG
ncbi:MAG: hypothetical protein ACLVEJ_10130 [Parabacteroides sp.]